MATTNPLNLNVTDVLRVLHAAQTSLHARNDITYIHERLDLMDVLGHFDVPDFAAQYDPPLPRPAACIAAFVGRAQHTSGQDLWEWCRQVLNSADLDALALANAAAARVSPDYAGWCHDVPVPSLCLYPDAYRLIEIAELPYGHAPGRCGYRPDGSSAVYHDTMARLAGNASRLGWLRRTKVETRQVWADIQHRIEVAALAPCGYHEPNVDWDLLNQAALDIRDRTPFTTTAGIRRWDLSRADEFTSEEAHAYKWPGYTGVNLTRMRNVLRSLFNDPILATRVQPSRRRTTPHLWPSQHAHRSRVRRGRIPPCRPRSSLASRHTFPVSHGRTSLGWVGQTLPRPRHEADDLLRNRVRFQSH